MDKKELNAIKSNETNPREAVAKLKTMKNQKNPSNTKKRAQANRLNLKDTKIKRSMKSNLGVVASKLQPKKDLLAPKKIGSMVSG